MLFVGILLQALEGGVINVADVDRSDRYFRLW